MAKRNSSGGSSGRRGSSRNSSGGSSSGGRKSDGRKSFRKSDSKGDDDFKRSSRPRSTRSDSGSRPGRGGDSKKPSGRFNREDSGDSRKRSSFKRRDEGGSSSSRSSYGRKSYGNRDGGGDSQRRGPYKKREEGDSSSRSSAGRKSYGNRQDSGASRSSFGARKSFGKREDGGSEGKSFRKGSSDRFKSKREEFSGDREKRFDRPERKSFDRGDRKEGGDSKFSRDKGSKEERGFFKKSKARYSDKPRRKSSGQEDLQAPVQTEKIRLNKYIANSGVCSRREADELIAMGLVSVNGTTITEMGYKVNPGDEVRYENKVLKAEKPVYILMNKPKGFLTTTEDPQERNTVMHILGGNIKERVYPVGRLDRNTTGLLLLTNDGDLAEKLMHPSYNIKKIYKVELDRPLTKADLQTISEGVLLDEGRALVDDIAIVSPDGKTVGLEIHIGWNRVVRRIFEALQYEVLKLDRTVYAGLDKKDLGRGQWRFLSKDEIVRLKHLGSK